MYVELPTVPGTAESRVAALKESRELLKQDAKVSGPAIFGGGSTEPGVAPDALSLIRLSTYIETGHDYPDLHPTGKRRPIIKNIHVTVMAPGGLPEDLDHLLSHVEDGSFAEFIEDLIKSKPEEADSEKSADDN